MTLARVVRTAFTLSGEAWCDLAWAAFELGAARLRLGHDHSLSLHAGAQPRAAAAQALSARQSRAVERIAFAIPRVAARLPWRSDCMVQALAAQHWLRRHGVESRLQVGVRTDAALPLDAHAWLMVADRIVTGGDVAPFIPLGR